MQGQRIEEDIWANSVSSATNRWDEKHDAYCVCECHFLQISHFKQTKSCHENSSRAGEVGMHGCSHIMLVSSVCSKHCVHQGHHHHQRRTSLICSRVHRALFFASERQLTHEVQTAWDGHRYNTDGHHEVHRCERLTKGRLSDRALGPVTQKRCTTVKNPMRTGSTRTFSCFCTDPSLGELEELQDFVYWTLHRL